MITRIQNALAARRTELTDGDKGFTLIELLVVVIIIGILAAIAIPVYIGVQNNAKDSAVTSDLTNLKTALVSYQTDTQATVLPALDTALRKYGYTNSGSYTTAPVAKGGSTASLFCIDATGKTGTVFMVSSNLGVTKGSSCSATTSTW